MNKIDLKDEIAVVTGGAQGIGFAIAKRLIDSGARVCLWDMDGDRLKEAKRELGRRATMQRIDITRPVKVFQAAGKLMTRHGKISILVNSAGIAGPNAPVEEYPIEDWKRIMDINVNGTFYMCRAIVHHMKAAGYGRIVNIASVAGKEGNPNASAYSASKAAVIAFTKSLGKEVSDLDIAVNCITPAAARTRIFDQMSDEHIDYMLSKIPRGRFVKVEEIAAMVAWLVSKENSYTTGAAFDLSGGRATY